MDDFDLSIYCQFIVLPKGQDIVDVVVAKPDPMSNIKICRTSLNIFHSEQCFIGDKAYVGETNISTPSKKPKNGELAQSLQADISGKNPKSVNHPLIQQHQRIKPFSSNIQLQVVR